MSSYTICTTQIQTKQARKHNSKQNHHIIPKTKGSKIHRVNSQAGPPSPHIINISKRSIELQNELFVGSWGDTLTQKLKAFIRFMALSLIKYSTSTCVFSSIHLHKRLSTQGVGWSQFNQTMIPLLGHLNPKP
jgi:hypothetical protein